eukprot:4745051-Amphidinium_carterae.1
MEGQLARPPQATQAWWWWVESGRSGTPMRGPHITSNKTEHLDAEELWKRQAEENTLVNTVSTENEDCSRSNKAWQERFDDVLEKCPPASLMEEP